MGLGLTISQRLVIIPLLNIDFIIPMVIISRYSNTVCACHHVLQIY